MSQTSTISLALPATVMVHESAQTAAASTVSGENFTAELDRQIQRDARFTQTAVSEEATLAETKAEKMTEAVGNNLPPVQIVAEVEDMVEWNPQQDDATSVQTVVTIISESTEAPTAQETAVEIIVPMSETAGSDEPITWPISHSVSGPQMETAAIPLQTENSIRIPFTNPETPVHRTAVHRDVTGKSATAASPLRADILQVISAQIPNNEPNTQQTLKTVLNDMMANMAAKNADNVLSNSHSKPGAGRTAELPSLSLPLSAQQIATSGAARAAMPFGFDVQPGLNQPDWSRVVSSRVVFMAREGIQHAELRLNPAQLGPVEVRLSIVNEQTTVTFLANHAATRDALEQALPRLRESFAESGLALGNAEVGQHEQSDYSARDEMRDADNRRLAQVSVEIDDTEEAVPVSVSAQPEHGHGVSVYA